MKSQMTTAHRELLLRLVLTALLLYALLHYGGARRQLAYTEALELRLGEEAAILRDERETLQARLAAGEDPAMLEALARERLGMVRPGEIIFLFGD